MKAVLEGQCHLKVKVVFVFKRLKGDVTNVILSKYEDSSLNNKIVAAWSSG